ncbi:alpha/beta hydrolase family protein [Gordonia sp. PP30]|uniref:alpha/beta hydrolase n=1 Tax=Gordonia sp. PP30 TaxID=2935861 RepID=UPI001FFE566E|nr:alpha/beta hydrolase [Gordonia sp. PP30]UQE75887.1 alpha/beta hydrolase family protein [Gordonia sp. PP30]
MISLSAVRAWPLEQLEPATGTVDRGAESIFGGTGRAQSAMSGGGDWIGATHDAAGRAIEIQAARGKRLVTALEAVAADGRRASGELIPMRSELLKLVGAAEAAGFTVTDDGRVTHTAAERSADASYLAGRITPLLHRIGDLDAEIGRGLTERAGQLTGHGRLIAAPGGGWDMPVGAIEALKRMPPQARRAYWESLWPEEIDVLLATRPETLGNLDGIPFADRARANNVNIRVALAVEYAEGRGGGSRARELADLLRPVRGRDGELVPRTFIAFSLAGNGRYIEQVGELHPGVPGVGVLIPGTGSHLGNSDKSRSKAAELAARSGAPVFVYCDGDLPQRIAPEGGHSTLGDPLGVTGTAVDPGPAATMGASLVGFGRALDAEIAAQAPGAPTTYIGHSYGGSVLGTAEQYGLRADNVVFASSAGIGVAHTPWHDPNPDVHRYSMTPPGDPIHVAQRYGGAVHGGDPDSVPGVQRLDTGFYGPHGKHPGALVAGMDAHSAYLEDPDSTAFGNLVTILRGETPTPYVDRGPDIPGSERTAGAPGGVSGMPITDVAGMLAGLLVH